MILSGLFPSDFVVIVIGNVGDPDDEDPHAPPRAVNDTGRNVNERTFCDGLFDSVEENHHLFRATLEARGQSAALRQLWDADRTSFAAMVADLVRRERGAGRAAEGPDALALATMLLELNDRMLERVALGGPLGREELVEGVVAVWLRSIYGRTS